MRALLTGATGFVGSNVAKALLRDGHEVWATLRPGADRSRIADVEADMHFIEHDLLVDQPQSLARLEPELCIHAAWYVEPGRYLSSPLNVDFVGASARLALALAESGCRRLVGLGTCYEYDVDSGRLSEETQTRPQHLYSASKLSLFLLLEQIAALTELEVAWARLFYLYGPYEDERRLVSSVAQALVRGERVEVTAGEQLRDFLHVEDVGSALAAIAGSEVFGSINVCSGEPVTVREIVETLGRTAGRPELIALGARPYADGDPLVVSGDNQRLRREVGWSPRIGLADGLEQTWQWWRDQASLPPAPQGVKRTSSSL
jgi:nucleoside-diphosphate-sugar epimerase